jgi:hypothetical protein
MGQQQIKQTSVWKLGHRTGIVIVMVLALFRYVIHVSDYGFTSQLGVEFNGDIAAIVIVYYPLGLIAGATIAGLWRAWTRVTQIK